MAPEIDGNDGGGSNRTAAHVILAALKRHGVETMFGQSIPSQLYLAAPEFGIRQISFRTEKAGPMMADGFARISNRVPVVTSISGPGAALLVAGMGEAYKASIPMVALIQDTPRPHTDRNHAQDLDHADLLRAVTKMTRRVERADRIDDYIDMAFTAAAGGRPGPVALLLPGDLFNDAAPASASAGRMATLGRFPLDRVMADPAAIARAAELIATAKNPVVVAGGGVHVSQAQEELARLQDLASLPVATTMMGKGAVDEVHPLSLGVVGYVMGRQASSYAYRAMLEHADLVFLIGNRTNQNGTDNWSIFPRGARFLHLDIDGQEVGRNYEAERLVGDARLTLQALNGALEKSDLSRRAAARGALVQEVEAGRKAFAVEVAPLVGSDAAPIRPERVMAELESRMTPESILVADASYATIWAANYVRFARAGQRFVSPRGLAGIGWGFPMALGAKLAAPEAPVWFLGGDGGFAHAWGELETARREGIKLGAIILNNQVLGYQKDAEDIGFGDHTGACHFEPVDHAAIARACGWQGIRVESANEIAPALAKAEEASGPTLIDVISDPNASAPITAFDGKL
ncbi:MAG: acetolactate synthase catalytic subunit [Rhodospirillaceae bacterium]|jgi:acetolactate synthase I/II/III large subunit|nr:acetolactate synthase catalytic subunit [Rhodospirillaceae bacterium]MBT6117550.1 acetolactate synthase catalytic subunit [Rhodospirillaceae bacterium]